MREESRRPGKISSNAGFAALPFAIGPNGIVTLTGASHSLANSKPRSGRDPGALPNLERYGSKFLEHRSFEEITLVVEGVVGCRVDGEGTLRRAAHSDGSDHFVAAPLQGGLIAATGFYGDVIFLCFGQAVASATGLFRCLRIDSPSSSRR